MTKRMKFNKYFYPKFNQNHRLSISPTNTSSKVGRCIVCNNAKVVKTTIVNAFYNKLISVTMLARRYIVLAAVHINKAMQRK